MRVMLCETDSKKALTRVLTKKRLKGDIYSRYMTVHAKEFPLSPHSKCTYIPNSDGNVQEVLQLLDLMLEIVHDDLQRRPS